MDAKQYCKLCDDKHVPGEHNTRDVKPRPWIREFLSGKPTGATVTVTKPRTVSVTAAKVSVTAGPVCKVCGNAFHAQRKTAQFCSPKCRVASSRRK